VSDAAKENSEALIVIRNGKLVYESYFGTDGAPIIANSVRKSFVSLASGFLLAEGKLASLDERVIKVVPSLCQR